MRKERPNLCALALVFREQRWLLPSVVLARIFSVLSPYVNIYMSAEIINELTAGRDPKRLLTLVVFTLSADLAIAVAAALLDRYEGHQRKLFKQKEDLLFGNKTIHFDYAHLEDAKIAQHRLKIKEATNINDHGIWNLINQFGLLIQNIVNILLSFSLTLSLFTTVFRASELTFGLFLLPATIIVLTILSVVHSNRATKIETQKIKELSETMMGLNRISRSVSTYQLGKDIRLYKLDRPIYAIMQNIVLQNRNGFTKYYQSIFRKEIVLDLLRYLINGFTYAYICIYALRGLFGVGSVIKYVGFIIRFVNNVNNLFVTIGNIRNNSPFIQNYLSFLDIENAMYRGTLPVEKRGDREYEIEFRNVSFRYPGSEEYALRDLSLRLRIGEKLAVVGRNGSGKTTFIKLLCRLYDPTEGDILLNGIDIRKYDYREYLSLFSVVFQDFKLFSFPLGQNVAASAEYDRDAVTACLKKAGLAQRLSTMPRGLDTPLYKDFEEDGVEISGGEAQKLALARALCKNAPFIVLDEPTAALDPVAEYEVYTKFNAIVGDCTAVYISHRLSSCRFCDDIAVFDNGRLVQRGKHEALLSDDNGPYRELWRAQAQYYA